MYRPILKNDLELRCLELQTELDSVLKDLKKIDIQEPITVYELSTMRCTAQLQGALEEIKLLLSVIDDYSC